MINLSFGFYVGQKSANAKLLQFQTQAVQYGYAIDKPTFEWNVKP
jgi:hypothetical protein